MREAHSPPPQLEDPDRALDPGLEEDPDTFGELIDRTFYQLSCDDAMVAIIIDYRGLLPASHVSKTGVPTSKKDPFFCTSPTKPAVTYQQGAPKPGRLKRKAVRTETPSQRYEQKTCSVVVVFKI